VPIYARVSMVKELYRVKIVFIFPKLIYIKLVLPKVHDLILKIY